MNIGEENATTEQDAATGPRACVRSVMEGARREAQDLVDRYDIQTRIDEHPLRAVAIALAAGYVIGGGLFSAATGRLLWSAVRIGTRLATLPLVQDEIMRQWQGSSNKRSQSESSERRKRQ